MSPERISIFSILIPIPFFIILLPIRSHKKRTACRIKESTPSSVFQSAFWGTVHSAVLFGVIEYRKEGKPDRRSRRMIRFPYLKLMRFDPFYGSRHFCLICSYASKNIFISSSTLPMPAIPNFSTKTLTTFGERNAGIVGPR